MCKECQHFFYRAFLETCRIENKHLVPWMNSLLSILTKWYSSHCKGITQVIIWAGNSALFPFRLLYNIIRSSVATLEPSGSLSADSEPLSGPPLKKPRPEISRSNSTSTHQRLTNQRGEGVVSRRWSVRAAANQRRSRLHNALASTIVGRLNGTLFMSTRRLFKETPRDQPEVSAAARAAWNSCAYCLTFNINIR